MEIDLFETSPDSGLIAFKVDPAEIDLHDDEFFIEGPVRIELHLNRNGEIVYIALLARATLILHCARCIEPFRQDIEGNVSFVVQRLKLGETVPETIEKGEAIDEDNLIFIKYNERSMDITDFVRDAVLLSIPLKPICNEQCKGLCPVCGQNKNERDCGCVDNKTDPRWQSLSKLMKKNSKR